MATPYMTIVAACDTEWGIAKNGVIPWDDPKDIQNFKNITTSKGLQYKSVVIMGKNTFFSIPEKYRPLSHRFNIVLSRGEPVEGAHTTVNSLEAALKFCKDNAERQMLDLDRIYVCGGGALYSEAMRHPACNKVYIHRVNKNHNCDIKVPEFDDLLGSGWCLMCNGIGDLCHGHNMFTRHNYPEEEYLKLMKHCIDNGCVKPNRTGIHTHSLFSQMLRYPLAYGNLPVIPLFTTKRVPYNLVLSELLWFLRGGTNTKFLHANNNHIWDGNSSREFLDKRGLTEYNDGELGPCFPSEVKTLTKKGYIDIKDIVVGDEVFTHVGNWKSVTKIHNRKYSGKLNEIKLAYHPKIQCTPEHPFFARKFIVKDRYQGERNVVFTEEPQWVAANEIDKRTLVGFKIETQEIIPELQLRRYKNQHVDIEEYIKTMNNHDEWFLMGYFVGDGWLVDEKSCQRIYFAINDKQENELVEKLSKVLKITCCETQSGCKKYRCCNIEWVQILKQFGKYAHGKYLPNWVHLAPKEYLRSFIDGYFMADGYLADNRGKDNSCRRLTTVSADLAYSVQRIYLKLGMFSSVMFQKREGTYKEIKQGHMSKLSDCYLVEVYETKTRRNNYSFIENGYAWYSVKSNDNTEVNDIDVYNMEVNDDESYTVENTSVHNCYGFQWRHFGATYMPEKDREIIAQDMFDTNSKRMKDIDGAPVSVPKLDDEIMRDFFKHGGVDQITNVINSIKNDPYGRRHIVSAWNPVDLPITALPPCHFVFIFYVEPDEEALGENPDAKYLSCHLTMRSNDMFLGHPFNAACYGTLTHMIAALTGLTAKELVISMTDCHVYNNHIEQVEKQNGRSTYMFPTFEWSDEINEKIHNSTLTIDDFKMDSVKLINYTSWPGIKAPMAV